MTRYTNEFLQKNIVENPEAMKQFIINCLGEKANKCYNTEAPLYKALLKAQNWVQKK